METREKIYQWQPVVGQEEIDEVVAAVESSWITEAHRTRHLEELLASWLNVEHVVLTNNGTVAIALALIALGIGHGDEVIIPDMTFVGTGNAVKLAGAKPVVVDVRPQDVTIDPREVERAISKRTKAIIPVHLNGRSAEMRTLKSISKQFLLPIVEDAAQALGSRRQGRILGTESVAGCFSLATTKIITTGQGGFIATNDSDFKKRLTELKDQGRLHRSWNHHPAPGFNFKFTDLQAAIGIAQFKKLPDRLQRMKAIYSRYRERLEALPAVTFLDFDFESGLSPWFVDIYVHERDELAAFLDNMGVQTRPFYPPLHTQYDFHAADACPQSIRFSRTGLWLPSSVSLTDEQIDYVCEAIEVFYDHQPGEKIRSKEKETQDEPAG